MGTPTPGYLPDSFNGYLRDKLSSNPDSGFISEYRVRISGRQFNSLSITVLREICALTIILEAKNKEMETEMH